MDLLVLLTLMLEPPVNAQLKKPPVDVLLIKPPVNRTRHMITMQMWANMFRHATYQIIMMMVLLFAGPDLFDIKPGHLVEREDKENFVFFFLSALYPIQIFSSVWNVSTSGEE